MTIQETVIIYSLKTFFLIEATISCCSSLKELFNCPTTCMDKSKPKEASRVVLEASTVPLEASTPEGGASGPDPGGAAEGALRPPEGRPGAAIQTLDPDPDPGSAASKAAVGGGTRGVDKSPLPFLRFFS
jgi:hypothetical protein